MANGVRASALAGLAVLMVSSVAASAAHGYAFNSESYPATVTGASESEHILPIGTGARWVACKTVTFEGSLGSAAAVSLAPSFAGCSYSVIKAPVTIFGNGCKFQIQPVSPVGEEFENQVSVLCPPGKTIDLVVYENEKEHVMNKPNCTFSIGTQGPIEGPTKGSTKGSATTLNTGTGSAREIRLTTNLKNISATITQTVIGGLCAAPVGGTVKFQYPGATRLKADQAGKQVGLFVE